MLAMACQQLVYLDLSSTASNHKAYVTILVCAKKATFGRNIANAVSIKSQTPWCDNPAGILCVSERLSLQTEWVHRTVLESVLCSECDVLVINKAQE